MPQSFATALPNIDHGSLNTNARSAFLARNSKPSAKSRTFEANADRPLVYICDHDAFAADELADMVSGAGFDTEWFSSPSELLRGIDGRRTGCIISELRLAGTSGMCLHSQLQVVERPLPLILMTASPTVSMAVSAMKAGAIDFLTKPLSSQDVLDAVLRAITRDAAQHSEHTAISDTKARVATLTRREAQVLREVVTGALNKQIAYTLQITEVTVKLHRASMMRKMGLNSVADLVRKWEALNRSPEFSPNVR
jgi:FixJ family two-component response regulator